MSAVTAVFQHGLLRPTSPLDLTEGETVRLMILPSLAPATSAPGHAAAVMAAIAALPMEPGPVFDGRDHDRILADEAKRP